MSDGMIRFDLALAAAGRFGFAHVNGYPVLMSGTGGSVRTSSPVSHLLSPERNVFGWLLRFDEAKAGAGALASAELRAFGQGIAADAPASLAVAELRGPWTPEAMLEPAPGFETPYGPVGPLSLSIDPPEGPIHVERDFTPSVEIPRWRWVDSPAIEDGEETISALASLYSEVIERIAAKDETGLNSMLREKIEEVGEALDLDAAARAEHFALPRMPLDTDWRLVRPDLGDPELELAMDGRLARLLCPPFGPPIAFETDDLLQTFDIWFRRDGDYWAISR